MVFPLKEFRLRLADREMDCITFGRGDRPMVVIQGLSTRGIKGAGLLFALMYRIFAVDHTVYLFDRRTVLREGVTVRELAADVAAAMDALGLTGANVLGVSQRGMMAQYLAMDRPELVNKLVLAVTLSRNNPTVEGVINRWIDLTRQGRTKELVRDMTELLYSEAYRKRYRLLLPLLTLIQKPRDPQRFITLAEACLTCRTYEVLNRITCPVLVIGGGQDQVVSGEASVELARKLGCQIYMYKDLGHAIYEESSDFNRKVVDFFRE